jgi:U3 small nucleolar RNA-associated protein 11
MQKLKGSLHLVGVKPSERKHTVFVDSKAQLKAFSPEEYFGTPAELLDRGYNRPTAAQLLDESLPAANGPVASSRLKKAEKRKHAAYAEMVARSERHEKVSRAARKMSYDKELMGKGRKRKLAAGELVGGGGDYGENEAAEPVYKWKMDRKK